jgi:hypothetical protein
MAKLNVLALPRPKRVEETRTFTDPAQPGVELTLTLRSPDLAQLMWADEQAKAYLLEFTAEDGSSLYVDPISGERIPVSENLCKTVAVFESMQFGAAEERYGWMDTIAIMLAMPSAWLEISPWIGELASKGRDTGNSQGAASETA